MRFGTLLLTLLLAACAGGTTTVPEVFRTGRDERYPPGRYLLGVGEGPTLETARRRAVASIAAQLQASLHATEVVAAEAHTGGAEEERLLQDIRVESRFDRPEWIRLADAVVVDDRVHALCVLDRLQAAALVEAELEANATALRLQLDRAEDAPDLRRRTLALRDARPIARALSTSASSLALLRGAPVARPSELGRMDRMRRELERDRAAIAIRVCAHEAVPGGPGADLARRFGALLAGAGIRALPCAPADASTIAAAPAIAMAHVPSDASVDADLVGEALAPRVEGAASDRPQTWTLEARIVADPAALAPQPGSYRSFCTVRLDYRLLDAGGVLHGGSVGGMRHRSGGHDFHQACLASATSVIAALVAELGLAD